MMKKPKTIALIISILIVFVAFISGCGKQEKKAPIKESKKEAAPTRMREAMRAPGIETATAAIKSIILEKQYIGEITPFYTIDLKSTASGWLTNIKVDTGDYVEKNGIICVIEHDDIQAQVEQAEANISVSKASVSRAEAELEKVKAASKRAESLYEKGYLSMQDLEQAQTTEKQAYASLDSAKGQLAQTEAQLKNILVKLRDSTIKAPFSGVVAERYVDPGAYVSPANPIVRLEDSSRVLAIINVVEDDFSRVHKGAKASILVDSYPELKFNGEIIRVSPSMDKLSRTAEVEILILNRDGKLKSGMTARVNLVLAKNPYALVIPDSALRRDVEIGENFVFTVADGKAVRRKVETGIVSTGEVEITSGLKSGDIVITGNVRISDGMTVNLSRRKGGPR